jgi:hypothetical protein
LLRYASHTFLKENRKKTEKKKKKESRLSGVAMLGCQGF